MVMAVPSFGRPGPFVPQFLPGGIELLLEFVGHERGSRPQASMAGCLLQVGQGIDAATLC